MRKPRAPRHCEKQEAANRNWRPGGTPELVSAVNKLILAVLVIALLIVLAGNPQALGHLVEGIFAVGAKLLHGMATFLDNLTH